MPGWSRIWGVPGNEAGQEAARFWGEREEGRGERTHETHQTAPSCLDYHVNAQCTMPKARAQQGSCFIPSQSFCQLVAFSFDFKYLYCFV